MKLKFLVSFLLTGYLLSAQSNFRFNNKSASPFSFTENNGQIYNQNYQPNPQVLYLLNMPGLNVQLKDNGFSYDIYEKGIIKTEPTETHSIPHDDKEIEHKTFNLQLHRVDFEFLNFNSNFEKSVSGQTQGAENYYLEHIPNGVLGVKSYEKVVYKNFYNNIDLEFVSKNDTLKPFEYNFILHPGAKLEDIQFKINGAENVLNDGAIDIQVQFGTIKETIPASWFEGKEGQKSVEIEFNQTGSSIYGLRFKNENSKIDLSKSKLIIDPIPVRQWGTYHGINGVNSFSFIYTLKYFQGDLYTAGSTGANGLATSGTFQSTFQGNTDGVLSKFSADGQRIWVTYCGTSGIETIVDLDFDSNNNIYTVGWQLGDNSLLATNGTHQPVKNNFNDGFIIKFTNNGLRTWGTYYGGEQNEELRAIYVDQLNNNFYVGGNTNSVNNISSPGAYQTNGGGYSGFFAKFDFNGTREWGSYYGGTNGADSVEDLKIDHNGNLIISGIANSTNSISTLNEHSGGNSDSYIAKFTLQGLRLWGLYVGGNGLDYMNQVDINSDNEIVIVGRTTSTNLATDGVFLENFYTSGGFQEYSGFVVKVDSNGQKLWGTYYGGYDVTWVTGVEFNNSDDIVFTGRTKSNNYIASPNGYDTTLSGAGNAFLAKLSSSGERVWGTYYGGDFGISYGYSLDLNGSDIYLAGSTTFEYGIATPSTHQPLKPSGDYDAFIVKFKDCEADTILVVNGTNCEGNTLELIASGGISYEWYGPNGYIGAGNSITIDNLSETNSGEYFVFIENGDCSEVKSVVIEAGGEEAPDPDINNLPIIEAVCSITLTPPTATDDCLGTITATTNNPIFYDVPGEYWITWIYEDNYGNQVTQDQLLILEPGDNFMIENIPLTICESDIQYDLRVIEPDVTSTGNVSFIYYESFDDMVNNDPILDPESYINTNNLTEIYVKGVVEGDCSDYTIINLSTTAIPIANAINPTVCDNDDDGISEIILNQYIEQINPAPNITVDFYEDENHTTFINPDINYPVSEGDVIYVLVSAGNCINQTTITVLLGDYTLSSVSDYEVCTDNPDLSFTFNLEDKSSEIANNLGINENDIQYYFSLNDARAGSNPLNLIFPNQSNPQTIYASYNNPSGCPEIISFDLVLYQNPIFEMPEHYQKCIDSPIEITAPEGYAYLWNSGETTQQVVIENEGEYSIQISNQHCTINHQFVIENFQPITLNYEFENSILDLNPVSVQGLEFSLNGVFWQNSTIFLNLVPGEYDVWVRTEAGCIQKETIYLYDKIPNFISPNGDGYNDTWDISFIRDLLDAKVFDRYGKTIFHTEGEEIISWDGFYLGRELPSGNYWYIINLKNGHKLNGSIVLKNH